MEDRQIEDFGKKTFWSEEQCMNIPLRSRLYSLAPLGAGTLLVESLTGYLNRMAGAYRVAPRILIEQEIVPHLERPAHFRASRDLLGAFCRSGAMSLNGNGEAAADWALALERLTMRTSLHDLTIYPWAAGLPPQGLLRSTPAWCPACYEECREKVLPLYQPLLWMLQVISVCPRHQIQLQDHCPYCRKTQSVIASKTLPGCCFQCAEYLGISAQLLQVRDIDDETLAWQQWVLRSIEELYAASASSGTLPWKALSNGLTVIAEIVGTKPLTSVTGISKQLLSSWRNQKQRPSFKKILELCYVLNISPLQLMSNSPEELKRTLQSTEVYRRPSLRHATLRSVDRERALELIRAVLDGRETPLGVRQIERRLGLGARTLVYHFPQECRLVTAQYKAYRAEQAKRRKLGVRHEVRRATLAVNAQKAVPTAAQVTALLSDRGMMRTRVGLATWHSVKRELGLEAAEKPESST